MNLYKSNYSPDKTNAYESGDENTFDDFLPLNTSPDKIGNSICYTAPEKYKQVSHPNASLLNKPRTKKHSTMKNQFMYINDENDSDEEYDMKRPLSTKKEKKSSVSYDSDDDFDNYLESKMLQKTIDAEEEYDMMIKGNNIDEEDVLYD